MKFKSQKGFSLVEMIMSMTLFLAASAVVFGAVVSLIRYQERMVAMQSMLNDSSYALEYMGRLVRMAQEDKGGVCIAPGQNYSVSGDTLKFVDYEGNCREFALNDGKITAEGVDLTSSHQKIEDLYFTVSGDSSDQQPRVTIVFGVVHERLDISFNMQTTVSQRNLNF